MLQRKILSKTQLSIFNKLKDQGWLNNYYLAGGTALALNIGHRKSEDFDFFSEKDFENNIIANQLEKLGRFRRISEEKNTLHGTINKTRITFLGYKYKIIDDFKFEGNLKIAGLKDLACMKLSAVTQRGTKKDFIDLYFILKYYNLNQTFIFFKEKYGINNYESLLLKSLIYFEDAEQDPEPIMLKSMTWSKVKTSLISQVENYFNNQ